MNESTGNLERLPQALREPARIYVGLVRRVAGGTGLALAFYGMVVADEFNSAAQAARSVLVVGRVDLDILRRLGEQGSRLARSGIAAPVVMTPEYSRASCDTFPLELMEIQQQNVLLVFGQDYFADLTFSDEHVRVQCERELKAALVAMHRGLLTSAGRERHLHPLAVDAAEGLSRVLRGILWLRGVREARSAAATVREVEAAVNRKLPGIGAALHASTQHGWDTFRMLYDDITALGEIIDAW